MVRVVVRPHPDASKITVNEQQLQLAESSTSKIRQFSMSLVLNPSTTQEQLFEKVVAPPISKWIHSGVHGALFAYGFTGTGKSFSLFGLPDQPGSISRSVKMLLEHLPPGASLRMSIYEVDGKDIRDLLGKQLPLTVRCDESGNVHLRRKDGKGPISCVYLTNESEFQSSWKLACESRRVGKSTVHDASSRTHAIVDLSIVNDEILKLEDAREATHLEYIRVCNAKDDVLKQKCMDAYKKDGADAHVDGVHIHEVLKQLGIPSENALAALQASRQALVDARAAMVPMYSGSFSFIDMAGNDWEAAMVTQTKQARAEHAAINSSLLSVKECFRAMVGGKGHVPFRRSVLTQILQRHFGATAETTMLTTVYPMDDTVTRKQTINTLLYASSISKI